MSTDDIFYIKENNKKDNKSFGQKAKISKEKRETRWNPNANNPNRNHPLKEVVKDEVPEKKDKKNSKHWNDKFIQQEIQAEEDAVRDVELAFEDVHEEDEEEEEEWHGEGPPPLDPDELERINDFCFQFAMDLRSRNDQELRDFVLKKQLEEMFQDASTFRDEDDTCEAIESRKTELVRELKAENRLTRLTISHLTDKVEANEQLIKRLLNEEEEDEINPDQDFLTVDDLA